MIKLKTTNGNDLHEKLRYKLNTGTQNNALHLQ